MSITGCRVELLGELRIVHGEHAIARFRTQKAAGLIAYLALFLRQVHTREHIADLFWPDKDPEAGRQNLTTILTSLRRQMEAVGLPAQDVLLSDRQTLRLNPACVTTDVDEFDCLLASAAKEQDLACKAAVLARLIALYRAEPLPGRYEDWAQDLQLRYSERFADVLAQCCAAQEALGNPESALEAAQHAVRTDPYREAPRGVLMRSYAALGRPAAAIESYQQYKRLLHEDMGVMPSMAMQALAERLRCDPKSFPGDARRDEASKPAVSEQVETAPPECATSTSAANSSALDDSMAVSVAQASLPLQLTRFFGREQEMAHLERLLCSPSQEDPTRLRSRVITLTGPGGAGKTRLSIEAANRAASARAFKGRIWFVELAHLPNPGLLPAAILNAMKLPSAGSPHDVFQSIEKTLGIYPCLLVLDNFEHLLSRSHRETGAPMAGSDGPDGADYIRLLLERVPGLTCLVTSRQPLHIGGEQEFPVPPLAKPDISWQDPVQLSCNASVALYTDRAILAKPDFALTPGNATAVAELCRRLEGMPLAIEMTAAWARTLSPTKAVERMEHQLDVLVSRRRDLPSRHRSMRATIEWSYDLLTSQQQRFLARLSVFHGGWTLEAAEVVCGNNGAEALELLAELEERSLIVAESSGEQMRYRLQATVREFGREHLEASGERGEIQRRHRDFFLNLAEESEAHVANAGQADLIPRLEEEGDNLRAAIRFCIVDPESMEAGLRFPIAMHHFWEACGCLAEGLQFCLALLQHPGAQARTEGRGNVLQTCFWMAFYQGEYAMGLPWIEEGLEIIRETGSPYSLGNALNAMGAARMVQKDYEGAQYCFEESSAIWNRLGDRSKICRALHNLASVVRARGDGIRARELFVECLALNRQLGDRGGTAATLHLISSLDYELGDLSSARRQGEAALRLNREVGNKTWEMFTLTNLAWVALAEGKQEDARSCCVESLEFQKKVGSKKDLASTLECLAELAHEQQQWERAGCLWGAATALRTAIGNPGLKTNKTSYQTKVSEAGAALGREPFQRAWETGEAMRMERMIQYALQNR